MLNAIINNPYRIIGVFSNTPLRDCVSNINKIKAYASIGKRFESKLDIQSYLPICTRDVETIEKAISSINQNEDKLVHALFWFCNITSYDQKSVDYLSTGDIASAKNLLNSSLGTFSGLINNAIFAFLENQNIVATKYILELIHNNVLRTSFIRAICGDTFTISESNMARLFLDVLSNEIDTLSIIDGITSEFKSDADYLIEKEISASIQRINEEVNKAKNAEDSPRAQLAAGKELMEVTKDDLRTLKSLAKGDNAILANSVIDTLAERILQCGINYYNETEDAGAAKRALPLQKYAMDIAVGKRVKDRCTENYNTIKANADAEPPSKVSKEASQIDSLFTQYRSRSGIAASIELLEKCARILSIIKEEVGSSNKYYKRVSSRIMRYVQSMVISAVNDAMDAIGGKYGYEKNRAIDHARDVLKDAWRATLGMSVLEIEDDDKPNFNQNKRKLSEILSSAGISTLFISSPISIVTESEYYRSCKSLSDYENYLRKYPNGKYANDAKAKMFEIKRKMDEEDRMLLHKISSTDDLDSLLAMKRQCIRVNVLNTLDDKCFASCISKKDFRKYIDTFGTKARHHTEADNKLSWDRKKTSMANWFSKHKGVLITIAVLLAIGCGLWFVWGPTPFAWIFGIIAFFGFGLFGDKDGDGSSNAMGCLVLIVAGALCFLFITLGENREKSEREEKAYKDLVSDCSISDCKSFLSTYPNSSNYDDVLNKLYHLEEQEGPKELAQFALDYSSNQYISQKAKERVEEICDSLYSVAESNDTESEWENYANAVPEEYVKDSRERAENIRNEAWSTESKAWAQASSLNTVPGYEKYLELYPKGAHKKQADKFLIDAEVNSIYSGDHGELPSMDRVSGGGGRSSYVSISNDTGYTLTILYSGPTSTRLSIPAHSSRSATLSNGTYRVAASVVGGGVRSFAGTETLSGGSYSASYYIITTRY